MSACLYEQSGVGLRVPVIFRHALFSSGSIFFAWQDFPHTGAQYSAVENEMTIAVIFMVTGCAPQLVFDNFSRMLFLDATFALVLLTCSLKDRVRSRVTPR